MMRSKATRALLWSSAIALSLSGVAQAQRNGYTRQISLPEGTVLRAELNDSLSSINSQPGDRFTGTIRSDQDGSGLPSGTEVVGQVTSVRRATEREPGVVDVDFRSIKLADGRTYPINASLTSLDSKNVRRNASGRLEARGSSSKDKTKFIGYGAGAGALIGVLAGGNLLRSAILGAAAGYVYGELNKDKQRSGRYSEVNLKAGTEFGVLLDRQMVLAGPAGRYGQYGDQNSRYDSRNSRYDSRSPRYNDRNSPYDNGNSRYDERRAGSIERYRDNDIRVFVNDQEVRFRDEQPFMSAGRVMVPVAAVLDAAGYRYDYDAQARELTVRGDRRDARLRLGDTFATVDGDRVRLDAPMQRINGVLYVPVQFLEESTDIRSSWDASGRTLRLTTSYRASSLP